MSADRIAKLYERLSNKERAVLAFHYLANANELELSRVMQAVPRKTYVCPDLEYQVWFDGIFNLACWWAIEHWKARSSSLAALAGLHITLGQREVRRAMDMIDRRKYWESCLVALDLAMVEVCEEHGVDPDVVRRLAGTERFVPVVSDAVPDTKYQAAIRVNLSQLLKACPLDGRGGTLQA